MQLRERLGVFLIITFMVGLFLSPWTAASFAIAGGSAWHGGAMGASVAAIVGLSIAIRNDIG